VLCGQPTFWIVLLRCNAGGQGSNERSRAEYWCWMNLRLAGCCGGRVLELDYGSGACSKMYAEGQSETDNTLENEVKSREAELLTR
jgi:hypothetical protein